MIEIRRGRGLHVLKHYDRDVFLRKIAYEQGQIFLLQDTSILLGLRNVFRVILSRPYRDNFRTTIHERTFLKLNS